MPKGFVIIQFKEPITEDDRYELALLFEYFGIKKRKKKIRIDFELSPLKIKSITAHNRTWAAFMKHINLDAKTWYEKIRDNDIEKLAELEFLFNKITKESKILFE